MLGARRCVAPTGTGGVGTWLWGSGQRAWAPWGPSWSSCPGHWVQGEPWLPPPAPVWAWTGWGPGGQREGSSCPLGKAVKRHPRILGVGVPVRRGLWEWHLLSTGGHRIAAAPAPHRCQDTPGGARAAGGQSLWGEGTQARELLCVQGTNEDPRPRAPPCLLVRAPSPGRCFPASGPAVTREAPQPRRLGTWQDADQWLPPPRPPLGEVG